MSIADEIADLEREVMDLAEQESGMIADALEDAIQQQAQQQLHQAKRRPASHAPFKALLARKSGAGGSRAAKRGASSPAASSAAAARRKAGLPPPAPLDAALSTVTTRLVQQQAALTKLLQNLQGPAPPSPQRPRKAPAPPTAPNLPERRSAAAALGPEVARLRAAAQEGAAEQARLRLLVDSLRRQNAALALRERRAAAGKASDEAREAGAAAALRLAREERRDADRLAAENAALVRELEDSRRAEEARRAEEQEQRRRAEETQEELRRRVDELEGELGRLQEEVGAHQRCSYRAQQEAAELRNQLGRASLEAKRQRRHTRKQLHALAAAHAAEVAVLQQQMEGVEAAAKLPGASGGAMMPGCERRDSPAGRLGSLGHLAAGGSAATIRDLSPGHHGQLSRQLQRLGELESTAADRLRLQQKLQRAKLQLRQAVEERDAATQQLLRLAKLVKRWMAGGSGWPHAANGAGAAHELTHAAMPITRLVEAALRPDGEHQYYQKQHHCQQQQQQHQRLNHDRHHHHHDQHQPPAPQQQQLQQHQQRQRNQNSSVVAAAERGQRHKQQQQLSPDMFPDLLRKYQRLKARVKAERWPSKQRALLQLLQADAAGLHQISDQPGPKDGAPQPPRGPPPRSAPAPAPPPPPERPPPAAADGPPAPPDVLQIAARFEGEEGRIRPGSAPPSSLLPLAAGAEVPETVRLLASHYHGAEGATRPQSAAPSSLQKGADGGTARDPASAASPTFTAAAEAAHSGGRPGTAAAGRARPPASAAAARSGSPASGPAAVETGAAAVAAVESSPGGGAHPWVPLSSDKSVAEALAAAAAGAGIGAGGLLATGSQ